jgi:hypothetical protein
LAQASNPASQSSSLQSDVAMPPNGIDTRLDSVNELRRKALQMYKTGNHAGAERGYAAALREAEKIGEKASIPSLSDMAGFYVKRGEPKLASHLLNRALILAERHLSRNDITLAELRQKNDSLLLRLRDGIAMPEMSWLADPDR